MSTLLSEENSPKSSQSANPALKRALSPIMSARPASRGPQESDDSSSYYSEDESEDSSSISEEKPYGTVDRPLLYPKNIEEWKPSKPPSKWTSDLENESSDDSNEENIPPE